MFPSLMIILIIVGFILWNIILIFWIFIKYFKLMSKLNILKLNILLLLSALGVILVWNILPMHFVNYLLRMVPSPSVSHNLGEIYRLNKTLYGLKQAPYAWFTKFSDVITFLSFHSSHHNPMLFLKCASSGCILLSLYVNDMIIMGDDIDKIVVLKFDLASHLKWRV